MNIQELTTIEELEPKLAPDTMSMYGLSDDPELIVDLG